MMTVIGSLMLTVQNYPNGKYINWKESTFLRGSWSLSISIRAIHCKHNITFITWAWWERWHVNNGWMLTHIVKCPAVKYHVYDKMPPAKASCQCMKMYVNMQLLFSSGLGDSFGWVELQGVSIWSFPPLCVLWYKC